VNAPRFRIAWVMVAVAVVAFDFGAGRAIFDSDGNAGAFLTLGALPMAHILAVGILCGRRRPGSRPFLLGFETFGTMALALYVVSTILFDVDLVASYLRPVLDPMSEAVDAFPPFASIPVLCSAVMVMLVLPQVVFALIGGFLSRKYRINITRRPLDSAHA
jgi:hypothetical protein